MDRPTGVEHPIEVESSENTSTEDDDDEEECCSPILHFCNLSPVMLFINLI